MESPESDGRAVLRIASSCFSLEAVKRASYTLMREMDVTFTTDGSDILCVLTPQNDLSLEQAQRLFQRELVDQDLRLTIAESTEAVRNTVLGLVFSQTGLQGE